MRLVHHSQLLTTVFAVCVAVAGCDDGGDTAGDAGTYADADADTGTDTDTEVDAGGDADADGDVGTDGDADAGGDAGTDAGADADGGADADAHADGDGDADTDTDTESVIIDYYTPDSPCTGPELDQNTCNGGSEVQTLLRFDFEGRRLYMGTTNWNDAANQNYPSQVLYKTRQAGEWQRTARLPAPTFGNPELPLCVGYDQVNDLKDGTFSGDRLLLVAVGASSYGAPPPCWAHGNVFASADGGASWVNTLLEQQLDAFYPNRTTEVRYIVVHRDATPACSQVPCLFALIGMHGGVSDSTKFATVWRASYDPSQCAPTAGLCWEPNPIKQFNTGDSRTRAIKANAVSVGKDLYVGGKRCSACEGAYIHRRGSLGSWSVFYMAPAGVDQIRALHFDQANLALFAAMNFDPDVGADRVFRFDGEAGDPSPQFDNTPVDEGEVADYPYGFVEFTQGEVRYLIASAMKKARGEQIAALSIRELGSESPYWTILTFPSITDDPLVNGASCAFRAVVANPWNSSDIIIGGYDAYLGNGLEPHLTATGFRITNFLQD